MSERVKEIKARVNSPLHFYAKELTMCLSNYYLLYKIKKTFQLIIIIIIGLFRRIIDLIFFNLMNNKALIHRRFEMLTKSCIEKYFLVPAHLRMWGSMLK